MQVATVIKRNGQVEEFNINKIYNAVEKAFRSCGYPALPAHVKRAIKKLFKSQQDSAVHIEDIQTKVEFLLMRLQEFEVAKAFILYREKHRESRMIREKIDYITRYAQSKENAANNSNTDANANNSVKNVASIEGEVFKDKNRLIQRQMMKDKLNVMFPEVAKQYVQDIDNHILYVHDEGSSPIQKAYTFSPKESVYAMVNGSPFIGSFENLYNYLDIPSFTEEEQGVYRIYPADCKVMDKDGTFVRIIALTKKERHRDLYRVKTSFGEDVIVTDNHPMIVENNAENTVEAINSIGLKQFKVPFTVAFQGRTQVDIADCLPFDSVYKSFVCKQKQSEGSPYIFTNRFIPMDEKLGYVVGFFIGDGNYDNTFHAVMFSQSDRKVLNKIASYVWDCFGVGSNIVKQRNGAGNLKYYMKICSETVYDFFMYYLRIKDKAQHKNLPYNLLSFTKEFCRGILAGIVDSNGTIQDNSYINIRLSSREAITQLTLLFKQFGYTVSNTIQATPFGCNSKIKSNYTIFGISAGHIQGAEDLPLSDKFKNLTRTINRGIKYQYDNATITDVQKVENSSFLDLCNYIYDITTESHTLMCNNLWMHNCGAYTLYPLMTEGVGNLDNVTPSPPNDIQSFSGQVTNLVFALSAQTKGAVALSDYFVTLNYYVVKEYGQNYWQKLDANICNDNVVDWQKHTIRREIRKGMKQFIYGINQPAGNRSFQSPFTNCSLFDKYYFQSMFGDYVYPDMTKPQWEAIDCLQRIFIELLRELRLVKPCTFPVLTMALLYDENGYKDKEYAELCAEEWAKGSSHFLYHSSNADSLSSCCRVQNKLSDNYFSSTTGMVGVMTGSCNVITLNINRIVQDWCKSIQIKVFTKTTLDEKELEEFGHAHPDLIKAGIAKGFDVAAFKPSLKKYLENILDRVYKYHIAYKTMLYELEEEGMITYSNANYLYIKKLYSTIGVLGYYEAAKFLGLKDNSKEYKDFISYVLKIISDYNKENSIHDKERPFIFNLEAVPGENLAVKLYNWDKADGYRVPDDQNLYNCYFFNPWKEENILNKIKMHGGEIAKASDGGQGCHINLSEHLSKKQYLRIMDIARQEGCNYFTFNIPMSECEDCHHVVNAPIKECPVCHSSNISYYTRIIGFLTKVVNWSKERQIEFTKRYFGNA